MSALLTGGYLLPISIDGFFVGHHYEGDTTKCELNKSMLIPLLVLAALLIVLGVAPVLVEGPVAAVAASVL